MTFWIWKTEIAFFVNLFLQCMDDIMETWMNKWMMHLYSALLCIVVHPKRFTIMWGGGSLLNGNQIRKVIVIISLTTLFFS